MLEVDVLVVVAVASLTGSKSEIFFFWQTFDVSETSRGLQYFGIRTKGTYADHESWCGG